MQDHPKVICTLHFKAISKNNDAAQVAHLRPAAHQSRSRNIHPPRVYLMELRHVHIHRVPSKYLHMPSSFNQKKKNRIVIAERNGGFFGAKV